MKRRALASSALVFTCSVARAQSGDQSFAQSLFDQANQLMSDGNYTEACPKFAESQRLDPGGGTLVNLGLCLEKEKKLASAWNAFNDALAWALRDANATREQIAREHLAAIEPKLVRITIDVEKDARTILGLDVTYDGVPIRAAAWGVPTPTDSGPHLLLATAPGKLPWRIDLDLPEDVLVQNASVPVLIDEPKPEVPKSVVLAAVPIRESKLSIVPWILGGAGVVAVSVGIAGAVVAFSEHGVADGICRTSSCPQRALDHESTANGAAWVANIGFISGALLVASAVVVYLVDAKRHPQAAASHVMFTF